MAAKKTDDTAAVLEKIAAMPEGYRAIGERLHELILTANPALKPRLWYGMPGYAKSKSTPVLCYFRADKYVTFGLTENASFDFAGCTPKNMCPTAWVITELDGEAEKAVSSIVKKGTE